MSVEFKRADNSGICVASAHGRFLVQGLARRTCIDQIYVNGLHAVVPFWVTNSSSTRLEIDIDTDSESLKVHQHNANWDSLQPSQMASYVAVTDTGHGGEEATLVCSAEAQRDFNEAFNQIDGMHRLALDAGQTAELTLLVLPAQTSDATGGGKGSGTRGEDEGDGGSNGSGSSSSGAHYSFGELAGALVLRTAGDELRTAITARFCRSVLEMEPATSRVYLDDCVVGKTYERVLRVRNLSAIALDWTMAAVETTDAAALGATLHVCSVDGDDGALGGQLPGGGSRQIVVRYTPQAVGEFLCRFAVENANDAGNTRHWVFRARASQRAKPRRVELLSAADIDFGDCTSGVWYRKDVSLKNIGDTAVVVRFRVEGRLGGLAVRVRDETGAALAHGDGDGSGSGSGSGNGVEDAAGDAGDAGDGDVNESASMGSEAANTGDVTGGNGAGGPGSSSIGDSSRRSHTHGGHGGHGARARQPALLDEVVIKPGAVRTVALALMGGSEAAAAGGRLVQQSFTLFCEIVASAATPGAAERLAVPCTLSMCTPVVRVAPGLLDFGTVDVGTLKTLYLTVENLSAVPATVACVLESKVINCTRAPIVVAPRQTAAVRVDIYPRRINARYRKQIIVRNMHTRGNDSVVDVRSVHVDQRRMAYHNVFYKTLVGGCEQNFVDFGAVPQHSRAVRRIVLANVCACAITLEVAPSDAQAVAAYVAVPRLEPGVAASAEAREVARRLPRLERQAEMHSTIERLKERQAVVHGAATRPKERQAGGSGASCGTGGGSCVLRRDAFIDKTVERGHVRLVPFARSRAAATPIDYLDAAAVGSVAAAPRRAAVRIREGGVGAHSDVSADRASDAGVDGNGNDNGHGHGNDHGDDDSSDDGASVAAAIAHAWDILDQIVEHMDMEPQTMFASAQAEDEYVRRQVDLRKYMALLVEAGFLTAATRIRLAARASQAMVVTLYAADAADAAARRLDANLFFRLAERPADLAAYAGDGAVASMGAVGQSYQLPVRRFLMQATLRRTELDVGQKSINVGNMQVGEACRKYLVIQNRSAAAVMYAIRKTGSIASGDIRFVDGSRYGVVRAFDSRRIVFVFQPALHGVYSEQIAIGNVLDPAGGKTATLKAVVRRPSKFFIQSLALDFGVVRAGVAARHNAGRLLVVRNMTAKTRVLAVRPSGADTGAGAGDDVQLRVEFPADAEFAAAAHGSSVAGGAGGGGSGGGSGGMRLLDRDAEEKIESLEQKIKIAVRKNYPDKVEKYRAKIAKLRGGGGGGGGNGGGCGGAGVGGIGGGIGGGGGYGGNAGGVGGEQAGNGEGGGGGAVATIERAADGTELVVTLAPHGEVAIPVAVAAVGSAGGGGGGGRQRVGAQLVVHEVKDKDNVKVVAVAAEVERFC
ncbi:hypothetical protein LPJ53_001479 [Coemansia erecta]|uniref:Uncharacterized protein n=1 Tax=Coemansia erecta TaxID=147472 RepID=A0A9W7Y3E4_9FUNG|nr:hypothetical protein LPJ53_001479 [Coemansia erecta]